MLVMGINPEDFMPFVSFVGSVVALLVYCLLVTMGWTQGGTPQKCPCRGKKGNDSGEQPLGKGQCPAKAQPVPTCPLPRVRTNWSIHPDMDVLCETAEKLNRTIEDLRRYLELSSCEMAEGSDSSLASIMGSEVKVSSVQEHQGHGKIQLRAPTPPPEMLEAHSKERKVLHHHKKCQETMEGPIPESTLEQELGLLVTVEDTLQNVPVSAPPTPHQPEKPDVMVPIMQNLPFLDEAVKRDLEAHILKLNIQRRYGLHRRLLECEPCFEYLNLK